MIDGKVFTSSEPGGLKLVVEGCESGVALHFTIDGRGVCLDIFQLEELEDAILALANEIMTEQAQWN